MHARGSNEQGQGRRRRAWLIFVVAILGVPGLAAWGDVGPTGLGGHSPGGAPGGGALPSPYQIERARQQPAAAPVRLPVPEEEKWIVHALNRLGFGPRPGDVERVRQTGLANYITLQLQPERIPDPVVEAKLRPLRTLNMSTQELFAAYPRPTAEERRPRALARMDPFAGAPREGRRGAGVMEDGARDPAAMLGQLRNRPAAIIVELAQAKVLRAIYSERQLQEVMVDFWYNHFNVFGPKGADKWLGTSYERDVIRRHALGRFRDLLGATAKHPAMLFYLDNWMSSREGGRWGSARRGMLQATGGGPPASTRTTPGN